MIIGAKGLSKTKIWQTLPVCEFVPSMGENECHPCPQNKILVSLR